MKAKLSKLMLIIMGFVFVVSCGNPADSGTPQASVTSADNSLQLSSFKVWGNCEMCKETIEGSLHVDGVSSVDWNVETKMMKVTFDTAKINMEQIQRNIAAVGYDTEKYTGDSLAYANLPGCCQYERKQ